MVRIYGPILNLVYIDDILLFSPNSGAHKELLAQFTQITESHVIMLSERKMQIGQSKMEFLGMYIHEGQYEAQPHIAQELLKFPDTNLTKTQIQQFLGIVNYLRDWIKNLSKYTSPLSRMLKKDAPAWSKEQTDASDKHWGAVLLEEDTHGKRQLCGYRSSLKIPNSITIPRSNNS